MVNLTRNQRIPHLQEKDMPVASWTCCIANSLGSGKKEVCGSSARLHWSNVDSSEGSPGQQEQQDVEKGA